MLLNTDPTTNILLGLIIWFGMFPLIGLVRYFLKARGIGLDMAYLAIFFMGHAPGAFIYMLPWYFTRYDGFVVASGFEISWIGVLSFSAALILGLVLFRNINRPIITDANPNSRLYDERLPWLFFIVGIFSYLILLPFSSILPSLTSIIVNVTNLQILGIVVGVWQGIQSKDIRKITFWILLSSIIPFLTVTFGGFLGYGIASVMTIGLFLINRIKFQLWHIPVIVGALYLSMSLYITYIDGRIEIREVVWGDEGYSERLEVVNDQFQAWQWFNWRDPSHLAHIDGRLNQNFLTGIARLNLENNLVQYGEGETLANAFIAFIPRIIWPEKPVVAGSNEIVFQYTLMEFAFGTSVAAGQTMEFFVNFGLPGVIIGFAIFGFIFAWIDYKSSFYLDTNNPFLFLRWYMIGIALLKPLDNLSVITAGVASALVTAYLLEYGLKWWFKQFGQNSTPLTPVPQTPALMRPRQ